MIFWLNHTHHPCKLPLCFQYIYNNNPRWSAIDVHCPANSWSAHLVNCTFDQMRCATDQYLLIAQHLTNCAIFGQSCSILAIALGLKLGIGLRLGQG